MHETGDTIRALALFGRHNDLVVDSEAPCPAGITLTGFRSSHAAVAGLRHAGYAKANSRRGVFTSMASISDCRNPLRRISGTTFSMMWA